MAVRDWLPTTVRAAGIDRVLASGQALFRSGDPTAGIYEVLQGRVQMVRVDSSGREVVLYSAAAGELFGEAALFSPIYQCDAISRTDAKVRLYPKDKVLAGFRRNPDAASAFMAILAREIMSLRTRIEQRNIRSASERVRHFLALNTDADGRTVLLRGTLKDLAAELDLTHEALYRALAGLAAKGAIKRSKNKIVLRDTK